MHLETPGKRSKSLTLMGRDDLDDPVGRANNGGHAAVRMVDMKASTTVILACSLERGLALLRSVLCVSGAVINGASQTEDLAHVPMLPGICLFSSPWSESLSLHPRAPPLQPYLFTQD